MASFVMKSKTLEEYMKRVLMVLAVVVVLAAFQAFLLAGKPVIAVKTFENPPNYANSTIGNGLTDLFTTELAKTGKYKIIERAQADTLTDEVDFGKSGYVEQKTAVRKGHIKGVEYYFMAKVTNFGAKQQNVGGGGYGGGIFGGLGYKKDEAYVRIDYRIVDATSAEVIYADYGEGTYSKKGISMSGGNWAGGGTFNFGSSEFLESMVGKATMQALNNVILKMDHGFIAKHESRAEELKAEEAEAMRDQLEAMKKEPGNVLAKVSDEMVIVDMGSAKGFKPGDQLAVIVSVDTKNSAGQVVFSEEKEVGTIELFDVQPDRSKAKLISGRVAEGNIVKMK